MNIRRCPRCGKPIPRWQRIHFACLVDRIKFILVGFLIIALSVLLGTMMLHKGLDFGLSNPDYSDDISSIITPTTISTHYIQTTQELLPSATLRVTEQPTSRIIPTETSQNLSQIQTSTPTKSPTRIIATSTDTTVPIHTPFWQQGRIAYMTKYSSGSALFIINLTYQSEPMLIAQSSSSLGFLGVTFSSSNDQIAYYQYRDSLFVIDAQPNANPISLGTCQSPSWSSTGNQILCRSEGNRFSILDVNNRTILQNLHGEIRGVIPSWSPDETEIVYASFDGNNTDIWIASLFSGNPVLLAGDSSENYAPAWSPDGSLIAYQSNQDSTVSEIWIMDRSGNNKQRLTFTPNGNWSRAPSWSPDSHWLAFVSDQNGSIGADYGEIFIISIETGELIQLTNTGGSVYDWRVSWGR